MNPISELHLLESTSRNIIEHHGAFYLVSTISLDGPSVFGGTHSETKVCEWDPVLLEPGKLVGVGKHTVGSSFAHAKVCNHLKSFGLKPIPLN